MTLQVVLRVHLASLFVAFCATIFCTMVFEASPLRGQDMPAPSLTLTTKGEAVTIYSLPADSVRARRVLSFLAGSPPLPGLDPDLPSGVGLFLAPDEETFDLLTGGAVPDWGAGVALPRLNRIVIPTYSSRRPFGSDEARTLRHEWAHIGLHQRFEGFRIPRWFDEGYAQWASGGWNVIEAWRLRLAMALGTTPPLDSLNLDWPRDRASADLAYMLSATAVEYLVVESGENGLELFLQRWEDGGNFDSAFRATYGVTQGGFEEAWKKYVKRRYGWLMVVSHSVLFWLFMGVALVILVLIRRGRNRESLARLRATDGPDRPAYWEWDYDSFREEGHDRHHDGEPGIDRPE